MSFGLRFRLSAMMFLEFFVWGAWVPVLSVYMEKIRGWAADDTTAIYGLMGLASIFMPIIAGQITDRIVATQKFLGIAHLIGGCGLFLAAWTTNFTWFYIGMLIWSLTYAPTIALTNSLAFTHIKDPERDFGPIRFFGTIGWIIAGFTLTAWRKIEFLSIGQYDCLYLAGGAAIIMGFFCFFLPDTPPTRTGVSPFAFLKAFSLLKKPRITIFLLVAFVGGMILQFYFARSGPYLTNPELNTKDSDLPWITSIGQWFEMIAMLSLPLFLKKLGPRWVLFLGMMAFAVRNLVFSLMGPYWLVVGSISLHGVSFVFFFVVSFIYMDMVAPKDIKGSAQGLLTLIVFGFGVWLGNMLVGEVQGWFTLDDGTVQWSKFHLVPLGMSILCAVIFILTFPKGSLKEASGAPQAEGSGPAESPAGSPAE